MNKYYLEIYRNFLGFVLRLATSRNETENVALSDQEMCSYIEDYLHFRENIRSEHEKRLLYFGCPTSIMFGRQYTFYNL